MRIDFSGDSDQLIVAGGIEDAKYGYSSTLPIREAPTTLKAPAGQITYASPGLMVGSQDPMMGFPAGLTFAPYAYVRNIGTSLANISARILYSQAGAAKSLTLPALTIQPHRSIALPINQAMGGLKIDGSGTLVFTSTAPIGTLLASSGSVDQSGNYYLRGSVAFRWGAGASKSSIYWTTAGGFDTMYSITLESDRTSPGPHLQ